MTGNKLRRRQNLTSFVALGGNCRNDSGGKRWCLKCRFEQCLSVGMDPQKRAAFKTERKKFLKSSKKPLGVKESSGNEEPDDDDNDW